MTCTKLFVVSDIHSYFTEFKQALTDHQFDENNKDHLLIICGDLFDRGKEAIKLYQYLMSVNNKIMIRGNHEDLMLEMIHRGHPQYHDFSNRTCDTAVQFAYEEKIRDINWNKLAGIFQDLVGHMVDVYETTNYIFVHGWIPVIKKDGFSSTCTKHRNFEFDENWRSGDWSSARWLNGIDLNNKGINVPGKTIVCGHWHCSYGHHLENGVPEFEDGAIWDPYYNDGIIAIDRCTVHTQRVNVIVLEDDLLN